MGKIKKTIGIICIVFGFLGALSCIVSIPLFALIYMVFCVIGYFLIRSSRNKERDKAPEGSVSKRDDPIKDITKISSETDSVSDVSAPNIEDEFPNVDTHAEIEPGESAKEEPSKVLEGNPPEMLIEKSASGHTRSQKMSVSLPFRSKNFIKKYEYSNVKVFIPDDAPGSVNDCEKYIYPAIERDNEYDKKAIGMLDSNKRIWGYLFKGRIKDMAYDYISRDELVVACVDHMSTDSKDVSITIGFYKDVDDVITDRKRKTFSLIGLSKDDGFGIKRYENLEALNENDFVEFEYDAFNGKYLVTDDYGNEIGDISLAQSKKLREIEGESKTQVFARIKSIGEGKCSIEVYYS